MNLFAFHYITNYYTLSSYQDCSLSFEVGLKDIHTRSKLMSDVVSIIVTGGKNAVKCPFIQPSEHPHPLRDVSYLSIVALSLR